MGKKGKRSKKKDAREKAEKILRETDKLMELAYCDMKKTLHSKAINQYREVIQLLESKSEHMVYTRDKHSAACYFLMHLEYRRRNYTIANECYNDFIARSKHISSDQRGIALLYYQLIKFRLSGEECQLSGFLSIISQAEKLGGVRCVFDDAVLIFRAHKQFDSAIELEMTFGSALRNSILMSKLSLALTYLEQYRIEFHQRSQMRKEDIRRIDSLIDSLKTEYPLFEDDQDDYACPEYSLVLAQWYYLSHTRAIVLERNSMLMALGMVKYFLCELLRKDIHGRKIVRDNCYTCGQAATSTEVKYVCSGCRVACYCSIDHQRATRKKEAIKGMHIGHEILCPLYKAFQKYRLQIASVEKDKEKESKMQKNLDRQCVKFLEYGLGLKNKCFPCEY